MGELAEFPGHDVAATKSSANLRQWVVNLSHFGAQQRKSADYGDSEELLVGKENIY